MKVHATLTDDEIAACCALLEIPLPSIAAGAEPSQVEAGIRALITRRWLTVDHSESPLNRMIARMVEVMSSPSCVVHLAHTDAAGEMSGEALFDDGEARVVYTPVMEGVHALTLTDDDLTGLILNAVGLDGRLPTKRAGDIAGEDGESTDADTRAGSKVVLTVVDIDEAHAEVRALAWFVREDGPWIVDTVDSVSVRSPTTHAEVATRLRSLLGVSG